MPSAWACRIKRRIDMNNKCFFISLLLLALSFLPLRAQDWDKVKLQTLSGDTTTPADWVDGRTPYVVSFWFVTCQHCLEDDGNIKGCKLHPTRTLFPLELL